MRYWKWFAVHLLTGLGFSLLFSLGFTFLYVDANPLLLLMAFAVPVVDIVVSLRHVRRLQGEKTALLQEDANETFRVHKEEGTVDGAASPVRPNLILTLSLAGFGLGTLLYLLVVLAVFQS